MNFLKFIYRFIVSLFLIALVLAIIGGAVLLSLDVNKYKGAIETAINRQTGQKVLLNGPVTIKLFPYPTINLTNASVSVAGKERRVDILAQNVKADLDWSFLSAGKMNIKELDAKNVTLKITEIGTNNAQVYNFTQFTGNMITTCCTIEIPNFEAINDKTRFTGEINFSFLGNFPYVDGKIRTPKLELPFTLANKSGETKDISALLQGWLTKLEGTLNIEADNLSLSNSELKKVNMRLDFTNKKIIIMVPGLNNSISGRVSLALAGKNIDIKGGLEVNNELSFFLPKIAT